MREVNRTVMEGKRCGSDVILYEGEVIKDGKRQGKNK